MKKDGPPPLLAHCRREMGKWYIKISEGESIYVHSNKFMCGICVPVGQTMLFSLFYKAPE